MLDDLGGPTFVLAREEEHDLDADWALVLCSEPAGSPRATPVGSLLPGPGEYAAALERLKLAAAEAHAEDLRREAQHPPGERIPFRMFI